MKDVKYRVIDAYIYDYPYIQKFLSNQAAQGWHLEKAGSLLWKFRRGEPKQVRYEVTYSSAASAFNSKPTDAEEDLADLCAQAGWVRVAAAAQLQVFRNENPNATPLETDELERLKNIRKTMKKHFFPQYILMIALFLMQFFMHGSNALRWPTRTLSDPLMVGVLVMLPLVCLIYLILCADCARWLRRAERAVETGEPIPENRFYRSFRWVIWASALGYIASLFLIADLTLAGSVLSISAVVLVGTYVTINICKALNAPKWVNIVVPVGVTSILMMLLLTLFAMNMDRISMNEELPRAETLPVTLTQLTGEEDTERLIMEENSSPLASYGRYWDTGADGARLTYTIADVKCPLFYDMILNEQEQQFLQGTHYAAEMQVSQPAALFDAEYARHYTNELGDYWFVCWEDRIVYLKASWELTEEQIGTLKDLLMPA